MINARQRAASHRYKKDLDEAWTQFNEVAENIASTHHKSVRRVEGELHLGRSIARTKRSKTSAWNAFCWKKRVSSKETNGDESMNTSNVIFYISC